MRKIKKALISVSDKTELHKIITYLDQNNIDIISTGGTAKYIKDTIGKVTEIEDYTGYPEILGGRVKTLNPMVHGGILAKRSDRKHDEELKANNINHIDLVIVNLYPFEKTIANDDDFNKAIENIDVGGPTMIRAAAKNFNDVTVITDPSDYEILIEELSKNNNHTNYEYRKTAAIKAFNRTQKYDKAIYNWFSEKDSLQIPNKLRQKLRYGENPHQNAELYETDGLGLVNAKQLQGKELSYNNFNDGDTAYKIVKEFEEPIVAIIKHANPCGIAAGENILDAFNKAYNCDQTSSFGGVVALNQTIDKETAIAMSKIFFEVIIAPSLTEEAAEILAKKKNLRVLIIDDFFKASSQRKIKSITGGLLVQDEDINELNSKDLKLVTEKNATNEQTNEMLFAFKIIKHVKSNAVLFSNDKTIIAIGAGQMSRVDAANLAKEKLNIYLKNNQIDKDKLVFASDAFFPFADGLVIAAEAGAKAVIQPGGSIRDDEVIQAANKYNISMVFTGIRHFAH